MKENTAVSTAQLGEHFLWDNQERYKLRIVYDDVSSKIRFLLEDEQKQLTTVLDGSDIFRQAQEHLQPQHSNGQRYRIDTADGAVFTGTEGDIGRWYCLKNDIRLYICTVTENKTEGLCVCIQFPRTKELVHIADFEGVQSTDIETAYRILFKHMQKAESPSFTITEL